MRQTTSREYVPWRPTVARNFIVFLMFAAITVAVDYYEAGDTATLSCGLDLGGLTIISLQWRKEGLTPDDLVAGYAGGTTEGPAYTGRVTINPTGDLLLTNVQQPDEGNYTCTGVILSDFSQPQEVQVELQIAFRSPSGPEMSGYDSSSPPQAGDNNPLQCQITGGNPLPSLRWTAGGVAVPDSQIQTSTVGSTVTSQLTGTLQAGDNGKEFVCTEEHILAPDPPRSDSETITVYFASPSGPVVSGYNPSNPPQAGDNNPLQCQITGGNPLPSLRWTAGGAAVPDSQIQTSTAGSTVTSQLTVTLQAADNGKEFVCTEDHVAAPNPPRSDSETLIVFFASPSGPEMSGYNPSNPPQAGDNNPLQCQITGGNPLPSLRWTAGGTAVPDSQIQTSIAGSTVTSQLTGTLQAGDNGKEFVCTEDQVAAPNPARSDSETITVYFPPSTPSVNYTGSAVTAGDSFTATCQTSTGNPTPTLTWYLDSTPVGTPGAGSSQLVIDSLTKDNNGQEYVCRATNAATGANPPSEPITLLVHYPLEAIVIRPESTVEVVEGRSATLTCEATGGNPTAVTYTWRKQGNELPGTSGAELKLNNIHRQETGNYTCTAENGVQPDISATRQVIVQYIDPPSLSPSSPSITIQEGQSVSVLCTVDSVPTADLKWTKEGSDDEISHGSLDINNINRTQAGNYFCVAINVVNSTQTMLQLIVTYKPDLTITPLTPVEETDDLTLTCTADSNPDVTSMSWTHVTSGRDIPGTVQGNVLTSTIQEVTYEDRGDYTCMATNIIGSAEETVDLIVNFAPKFTHDQSKYAMGLRQNVTMVCSAIAYPTPITFSWSMNGTEITARVSSEDGVSTLTIVGIQTSDYGNYTCTARNDNGNRGNAAIFQLVAETAPEPSQNLDYTKKTAAGLVTLTWTAEFNGGLETTHTVQYRKEETTDWVNGPSAVEAASQNRPEFTQTVTFSEKGRYEIRIQAENREGAVESDVIQVLVEGNQTLYGTLVVFTFILFEDFTEGACKRDYSKVIVTLLNSIFDSYKGYEGAEVTACSSSRSLRSVRAITNRADSIHADFKATVAKSEKDAAMDTFWDSLAEGQLEGYAVDAENSRISDTESAVNGGGDITLIIIIAVVCVVVVLAIVGVAVFVVRRRKSANGKKDVELKERITRDDRPSLNGLSNPGLDTENSPDPAYAEVPSNGAVPMAGGNPYDDVHFEGDGTKAPVAGATAGPLDPNVEYATVNKNNNETPNPSTIYAQVDKDKKKKDKEKPTVVVDPSSEYATVDKSKKKKKDMPPPPEDPSAQYSEVKKDKKKGKKDMPPPPEDPSAQYSEVKKDKKKDKKAPAPDVIYTEVVKDKKDKKEKKDKKKPTPGKKPAVAKKPTAKDEERLYDEVPKAEGAAAVTDENPYENPQESMPEKQKNPQGLIYAELSDFQVKPPPKKPSKPAPPKPRYEDEPTEYASINWNASRRRAKEREQSGSTTDDETPVTMI